MHIGFYNPFLDSLSGGERYILTLAEHWSKHHVVDIFWDDQMILSKAEERLSLDLSKVNVRPNIFRYPLFKKLLETQHYDCMIILTDGSIPSSLAKYNILHVQAPYEMQGKNIFKLSRFQKIVFNSHFTQNSSDPYLQKKGIVIYPPAIDALGTYNKKEHIILSVGRIHPLKKQDILIDCFKKFSSIDSDKSWKMFIVGGLQDLDNPYYSKLLEKIEGHSISILPNLERNELLNLYKKAKFYWHATGFGEVSPASMEHFGITTVEAMSYGCIPLSFRGGGQVEVIDHEKSGRLWSLPDELIEGTISLLRDKHHADRLAKAAEERSLSFTKEKFLSHFDSLLTELSL